MTGDGGVPPRFVAYVYPGWHPDPYRPGVDEWDLLDRFRPYFPGHRPPARPIAGRYDDSDPAVVRDQIDLARRYGIDGFTYFLYRGPDGFVMDDPRTAATGVARESGGEFGVGATWCVRLPHDTFPVPSGDRLDPDVPAPNRQEGTADPDPLDLPIQRLSLRDLARIVDGWDDSWLDVPLTPSLRRATQHTAGPDGAAGPLSDGKATS